MDFSMPAENRIPVVVTEVGANVAVTAAGSPDVPKVTVHALLFPPTVTVAV